MNGMNLVILCGRLAADPEIKFSAKDRPYCSLRMATNRSYKDKDGVFKEVTDWHSIFVWGSQAERCCHYYRKGDLLMVEGSLTYWKVAQETTAKYLNAIQAERVNLIVHAKGTQSANPAPEATIEEFAPDEDLDNPPGARNHNAVAHPA